jgi:hypothetical protein
MIGWSNYLWVWAAVHQIGYLWFDGRLPGGVRGGVGLLLGGLTGLAMLTALLDYPLSMVGVPGALRTNNTPPTVALLLLALAQTGLLVLARGRLAAWLSGPRLWAGVTWAGSRAITLFLWHQTALVAVVAATYPTGLWPATTRVDPWWWVSRPAWFLILGVALAVFVAVFGRFERGTSRPSAPATAITAAPTVLVGVVLSTTALAVLASQGLYTPGGAMSVALLPLALLTVGLMLLGALHSPARLRSSPQRRQERA